PFVSTPKDRPALGGHPSRPAQRRPAQAGVPGDQSERQGAGDRRRLGDRVRTECDPCLSGREERKYVTYPSKPVESTDFLQAFDLSRKFRRALAQLQTRDLPIPMPSSRLVLL